MGAQKYSNNVSLFFGKNSYHHCRRHLYCSVQFDFEKISSNISDQKSSTVLSSMKDNCLSKYITFLDQNFRIFLCLPFFLRCYCHGSLLLFLCFYSPVLLSVQICVCLFTSHVCMFLLFI